MTCTGSIIDGRVSHDGDTCPLHEDRVLCIGTKRGIKGVVFAADGTRLGRVTQTQRRLRGTGGGTGTAFTAVLETPDGDLIAYLGTRHADRWSAAHALREFWASYPPAVIAAMVDDTYDGRWLDLDGQARQDYLWKRAASRAAGYFKYDRHDVCGLLARYRGADPRRVEADARRRMAA